VEGEEPCMPIKQEDIAEAASLLMVSSSLLHLFLTADHICVHMYLQEAHGLDTEVILACATHMLGGAEGLWLFSNGPNTKAIAFSINNGPKELIHWHFSKQINRLITFKPSGEILYTRCTIYWCSRTITYFNKVYSFFKQQYITFPLFHFFWHLMVSL
jgi:hypothetical protein